MNAADRKIRARLEALLDAAERSGGRLSFEDVRELAHLYRLASAQLAVLRSRGSDPEALRYLNALCVRAYTHLQVAPPRREAQVGRFYFARFPATLAATAWLQGLVAIVLLAGALTGATIVAQNPANIYAAIPSAMYPADDLERLVTSAADREKFLDARRRSRSGSNRSFLPACSFTILESASSRSRPASWPASRPSSSFCTMESRSARSHGFSRATPAWPIFWAWLLPHAIPELLAITLCSTAGLLIAKAVLAPGRRGICRRAARRRNSGARIGDCLGSAFHRRRRDRKFPAAILDLDCRAIRGRRDRRRIDRYLCMVRASAGGALARGRPRMARHRSAA